MALPEPNVIEHELETAVAELIKDYRWLFHAGYENPNTGEVKVSGGGPSDPTAGAVASQAHVRSKLRWVVGRINTARKIIEDAHKGLDKAFDMADRRCEPLELLAKKVATDKEVTDARRAQQRREKRGEGFGIA